MATSPFQVLDRRPTVSVTSRRQLRAGNYVKKDGEIGLVLGDENETCGDLLTAGADEVIVLVVRHTALCQQMWRLQDLVRIVTVWDQPVD